MRGLLVILSAVSVSLLLFGCGVPPREKKSVDSGSLLSTAKEQFLQRLIKECQSGGHQDTFRGAEHQDQDEAADLLLAMGEPGIKALLNILKTGNWDGRLAAVRALSKVRNDARMGPALEKLLEDSKVAGILAQWTRASLCRIGYHYEEHFAVLKKCLETGEKESVSDGAGAWWVPFWETLWALAFVGDDNAFTLVENVAKPLRVSDQRVCQTVYFAVLGDTRNPKAVPLLLECLNGIRESYKEGDASHREQLKEDAYTQGELLLALGKCGGEAAFESLKNLVEEPVPIFRDNDLALALGEIRSDAAFSLLCKVIEKEDFFWFYGNPYNAFRNFPAEKASPFLLKMLEKEIAKPPSDHAWVAHAIEAYSLTVYEEAIVPVLEKAYLSISREERSWSEEFRLARIAEHLYFVDTPSSRSALERLASVGGSASVPPLIMLARQGVKRSVGDLITVINQIQDPEERQKCLKLVEEEKNPLLLPVLQQVRE